MSTASDPALPASTERSKARRLNGWKEIAAHLGKGVRTVQRWEVRHGLPVHRIGREDGEIVFCFAAEVDEWARRVREGGDAPPNQHPGPASFPTPASTPVGALSPAGPDRRPAVRGRPVRRALSLAALGVVVFAAVWAASQSPGSAGMTWPAAPPPHRPPTSWTLAADRLEVLDPDGVRLFVHALGFETASAASLAPTDRTQGSPVQIADIDGDLRDEVLLAAPAADPAQRRLYCFEGDGAVRWVHQARGTMRFGDTTYGEPWLTERLFVTRRADGTPSLWVVFGQPGHFPSWLQELGPDGTVRQDYRSNGRISYVADARWRGRDIVLVGGSSAGHRAASLAVLDRDAIGGSAPDSTAGSECAGCPKGGPAEFLVFPRLCLTRAAEDPTVQEILVDADGGLTVETLHRSETADQPRAPRLFTAHYVFDETLRLVRAEISREFQVTHAQLDERGLTDHPYGPRDDARLFPVLRHEKGRFAALPAVPVGH